ncbi:MAG TPA: DNA-formamidopyrimidine glycosylase family protein, partial [Planctomycetota bacterium]|nr:DNA-formamidopyrimidine glycosylase family protein [Planctomycetota bacterium]
MPELPEVEVTRRQLEPLLVGRRVARVYTTVPSYFFLTPPAELRRRLRGRRFELLERIGKYLLARLDNGDRLLLHLGMTGQIFGSGVASVRLLSSTVGAALKPEEQLAAFQPDKHTHLRLRFEDDGPEVFFRDARKFGKVQLMRPGAPSERLDRLGPDALGASGKRLVEFLRGRKAPIKALLLDQALLAGVGNIYA